MLILMKLQFLGGAREVGRSCIHLQTKAVDTLLDCGIKMEQGDVKFPSPRPVSTDAIVVTHCHLDHSGFLPAFFETSSKRTPYLCTPPTEPLVAMLLEDSLRIYENKRKPAYFQAGTLRHMEKFCHVMGYKKPYELFDGSQIELFDAGHVLGSAQVLFSPPENEGKPLLYTGDMHLNPSRMHNGADAPDCGIGTLIIESTYADREHPDRLTLERKFCKELVTAYQDGFSVLIPAFAVGRAQELLMILSENDVKVPVYLDGMAQAATELTMEFSSYIRDGRGFREAVRKAHFVSEERRRQLGNDSPAVIIATAGMLEGGPILGYLSRLSKKGKLKVFITGYQLPGTNGRRLLDSGFINLNGKPFKVDADVQVFDFSAHSGKAELFEYVRQVAPEKVFCVHGDEAVAVGFAQELAENDGFDAVAPALNRDYDTGDA